MSIQHSILTGIRWAAWSLVPLGVLLALAIVVALVGVPVGLVLLESLGPFVFIPFVVVVLVPAILAITVGWTLLVRWKPAIERNPVVAYLGSLAWTLVILAAVAALRDAAFPRRSLVPEVAVLPSALFVLAPRVFVRSLRPGRLHGVVLPPSTIAAAPEPMKPAAFAALAVPVWRRVAACLAGLYVLAVGSLFLLMMGMVGLFAGFGEPGFRILFLAISLYVFGTASLSLLYTARPRRLLGRVLLVLYLVAALVHIVPRVMGGGESSGRTRVSTRGSAPAAR